MRLDFEQWEQFNLWTRLYATVAEKGVKDCYTLKL